MTQELTLFDMREKKRFTTDNYKIEARNDGRFAVTMSPSGTRCYRIMGKE